MSAGRTSVSTLEFLIEPALEVRLDGTVALANSAARRLLAAGLIGKSLFELSSDPPVEIRRLLRRAAATNSPNIDAMTFETADGARRLRLHAARVGGGEDATVVLHLLPVEGDQFAVLNGKVRELDRQLRQRMQEKAALEEALRNNRTLLDELQHRVKNNLQMFMTLLRVSAEGHWSSEVREVVAKAGLRLQAMASAQEAVYQSDKHDAIRSDKFLRDLIATIGESTGYGASIESDIANLEIDSTQAHCIALIVNELVTNAGRHALRNGQGTIWVALTEREGAVELTVADDGPGIPDNAERRHSGLYLVRSLCRQIGGRFDIATGDGTICKVRFGGSGKGRP